MNLWLAKAEEDLLAGDLILRGSMPSYETVSFHAQQAAEKALKALLVRYQVDFSKTHNIGELLLLAELVAPRISEKLAETRTLTPYAVGARYPGEGPQVDREEADQHLSLARKVVGIIDALLKPYLDAGRPGG